MRTIGSPSGHGYKSKTSLNFNSWLAWFVYFKFNNYMKERSMFYNYANVGSGLLLTRAGQSSVKEN